MFVSITELGALPARFMPRRRRLCWVMFSGMVVNLQRYPAATIRSMRNRKPTISCTFFARPKGLAQKVDFWCTEACCIPLPSRTSLHLLLQLHLANRLQDAEGIIDEVLRRGGVQ